MYLLQLAREYQMDKITNFCKKFLMSYISSKNCHEICRVAEQFDLEDVMSRCLGKAKYTTSKELEKYFVDLNDETMLDIYFERIKTLENILKSYVETCSNVVIDAYTTSNQCLPQKPCKEIDCHGFTKVRTSQHLTFDIRCVKCINRVQNKCPSIFKKNIYHGHNGVTYPKDLVDKLYNLGLDRAISHVIL